MLQMGFFGLSDRYASLDAKKDPLVEINAVVPWEEFRRALERVMARHTATVRRISRPLSKPSGVPCVGCLMACMWSAIRLGPV